MDRLKIVSILKSKKLTSVVASAAIAGTISAAKVHAAPDVTRYNGVDRYETAAKVCEDGWKTNSDYAVIVNGENFPDALSAAPMAKKYNAPILLTGTDVLDPYTSSELSRLNVKNVFIIGGKGVVSQSIEDSLKSRNIKITRFGGSDRYETAMQVAAKLGKTDEAVIVNANDFKDGMTIASIAALKGIPIILTDGTYLTSSAKKYLGNGSKMSQIYVIGDSNTINDSAINGLSNVKRIGQGNDYEKNTSIIDAFQNEIDTNTLYIASAKDFPDSLGASALAPNTESPVLFVDSPMDSSTQDFLKKHIVTKLKILGGTGSISYDSEQIAKSLPLGVGSTENITDTIWQNEKYTPKSTMVITATDGNKKEVSVDWNLTKVNTAKPGIYTFTGKVKGTDKVVYATLAVKPIPTKVDDITETASSRDTFDFPTTVTAQMSDGIKSQVPVTWDYNSQSGNTAGVYVFYGSVDKYSKKVKLTLTINPSAGIASIEDFKRTFATTQDMYSYIKNNMPTKATALMDDGSTNTFNITWDSVSKLTNGSAKGTHVLKGAVAGYGSKVNFIMYVTSEGGVDPNPDDPGNGGDNGGTNPNDNVKDLGELAAIMQGDPYPSTVTDPTTKKQVSVVWNNAVSIDTSSNITNSTDQNIDNCRVSKITLQGLIGTKKVKATIGVIPKIVAIIADGGSENDANIIINLDKAKYSNGIVNMNDITNKLKAVIVKPNGERLQKSVTVLLWNPPYIDISNSNVYYAVATINHYSTPVVVTIKIN